MGMKTSTPSTTRSRGANGEQHIAARIDNYLKAKRLVDREQKALLAMAAAPTSESVAITGLEVSPDERAVFARLLRVLRQRGYWLGAFIEYLLEADGDRPEAVEIDEAIQTLKDIKGLDSWARWFEESEDKHRSILSYYGHRFFPDDVDRMTNLAATLPHADEGEQFRRLVQMWRSDHPKPPEPPKLLPGLLDLEDDD